VKDDKSNITWKEWTHQYTKPITPPLTGFEGILEEMRTMHNKKQADYGRPADPYYNVRMSQDFGVAPWVGCMMRANDKMKRLQSAAQGSTMVNESIEDSLLDLAVYCIIALDLYRSENG